MKIPPLDLSDLHLIQLVALHRGITPAAEEAGLSQSALSRHLQRIEASLGFKVFERTTRALRVTEAGALLLRDTQQIPMILEGALRRVREELFDAPKVVNVGVSRSVALAHLPGLFHAQPRIREAPRIVVSHPKGPAVLQAVEHGNLDLGVLTMPPSLPRAVEVRHRMRDEFVAIAAREAGPARSSPTRLQFAKWARMQSWLLPPAGSNVRHVIDQWLSAQNLALSPAMELDSFDLMVQLVSMRMGAALVPRRALAGFPRKSLIDKIKPRDRLVRDLIIVTPQRSITPAHVAEFIENVLFS